MPIGFPVSLDSLTNPTPADNLNTPAVLHSTQHADLNDIVEALEVKVGIDGSADANSLDYKVANKQPLDAELTAIAGLVSAADKLPYFTGIGTAALADLSPFARTVLDDANASAVLATLGAQSALTFPLASTLGGTGVNNAGTLTNASNTTITGGGTLALGGFTLTVPATGTAALLATANVFTVGQMIDGTADEVQLRVQGYGSQTANIQTWEASTNALLAFINPSGNLILGASTTYQDVSPISISRTITSATNYAMGFSIQGTYTAASDRSAYGMWMNPILYGGASVAGFYSALVANTTPGNIPYARAAQVATVTKQGTGTISYVMGLYIASQTAGTSGNYCIYTDTGINRFGDQIRIDGVADRNQLIVTGYTTQTLPLAHMIDNTATTNAIRNVLQLEARSSGTAAAGFGPGLPFYAETATNSTYQQQGLISTSWIDATNVSRKAKMSLSAYDTAARLGLEIEASGTEALLGFYGVAPIARSVLATGASHTVDDVITALQNLGLVKQS